MTSKSNQTLRDALSRFKNNDLGVILQLVTDIRRHIFQHYTCNTPPHTLHHFIVRIINYVTIHHYFFSQHIFSCFHYIIMSYNTFFKLRQRHVIKHGLILFKKLNVIYHFIQHYIVKNSTKIMLITLKKNENNSGRKKV